MQHLSLVFSFKNEEKNIPLLLERLEKTFQNIKNWTYDYIFVNDCSEDDSENVLIKLQEKFPITIINMSRTFGVGPCVIAGFRYAEGDAVVYMDTDLQDPPELIPKLIEEYEKGNDIVHTVREKRHGETLLKLLVTKFAYKFINFMSDISLPIESGDFKLISKRALEKILDQKEFRPYIRGLSVWVGYKQSFVKYERKARETGKSQFPIFSKGPVTEFISGVTSYSLKPLYLGIIFGFSSLLFSLSLIVYALFAKFQNLAIPGSTGIIITISFFSGILLLCLGTIGIYIARIFEQIKGRQQYIIKDIKKKN